MCSVECFSVCVKTPSDTKCHPEAWPPLLFSFYHCTLLTAASLLTCGGSDFKRTSLHFKSQQLPLQLLRLPRARTSAQLSAAQILCIPWPFLPLLPALTPPQTRAVEIIIFYACHSSPHSDKDYERRTKPTGLQTGTSDSLHVRIYAQIVLVCSATIPLSADTVTQERRRLGINIRLKFLSRTLGKARGVQIWHRRHDPPRIVCILPPYLSVCQSRRGQSRMNLHLFEVALLIHAKETWDFFFFLKRGDSNKHRDCLILLCFLFSLVKTVLLSPCLQV